MRGLIALVGSGEYLPVMDGTDRYLLENCGQAGRLPRVVCLPTAAGTEGEETVGRWMRMGQEHFRALGAEVDALHLTNRAEAADPQLVAKIADADLIYFSGGNPVYLFEALQGTPAWHAVEDATQRGAVYAGCSAGAMCLGEFLPDMRSFKLNTSKAFGWLPRAHIFPHFDRMARFTGISLPILQKFIPANEYALGLDEETALVGRPGGDWQVMGRQKVYFITSHAAIAYRAGDNLSLPG